MSLLASLPHRGALTTAGLNLNLRDRPARLACSGVDLLWVMGYTPGEGDQGTLISVNFSCKADLAVGIHIRLVVGRRAVGTQVHEIDAPGCGRWQLKGHAPSFAKQGSSSPMVPLTIQAVDKQNQVVDSVTFGDFVYSDIGCADSLTQPVSPKYAPVSPTASYLPCRSNHRSGETLERSSKRHSPYSQPQTPPSSDSEYGSSQGSRHTQSIVPALRRASRQMGPDSEEAAKTVVLEITTPLDSFCFDWEESELHAGRRLVRFKRLQDGNKLIVSAERISQAEYDADDIVISCIYREETDSCCVTSVDIIHLLQRLVDADFEVDEKNRIRRNLEGLRPTTVSKTRPGFESFFQRIMDFPDPKPRKIEKDVKVFDWKLLPHALDKILSKYTLCASPSASSPKDEPSSPFFSRMLPQGIPTPPSSAGAAYGDHASRSPQEPRLDALYLSQVSPVVQLAQFGPDYSPESSPEIHRRGSLQEEQLQPIYLDPGIMQSYYPKEETYGVLPSPGPLQSSMYTADSSAVLPRDTSSFGDQAQHDWATHSTDVMLLSSQEPIYSPAYVYGLSNSADSIDIYAPPSFPMNTYDSLEFQTLREHGAVLASPHA